MACSCLYMSDWVLAHWSLSWNTSSYCNSDLFVPLSIIFQPWADFVSLSRHFIFIPTLTPYLTTKSGNIHRISQAHVPEGDPIPNGVMSNWDYTPGRPPDCWQYISAHQQFPNLFGISYFIFRYLDFEIMILF